MKQDINLMPPVEHKTNKILKVFFSWLLIILVFGAGIYFGVIDKINQKNLLQEQMDHYTKQIEDYGDLQQEYNDLKEKQEQVEQLTVAMDGLKSDIIWTTLWQEIDGCLPSEVTFSGLSYSEHMVSVTGMTGLDDVTLSATMNKLRQLDDVTNVSIGSYSESEESQSFNMTISVGEVFDVDAIVEDEGDTNTEETVGGQAS